METEVTSRSEAVQAGRAPNNRARSGLSHHISKDPEPDLNRLKYFYELL